jgi:hypothetical protein
MRSRRNTSPDTGIIPSMARTRKITIEIEEDLLRKAQKQSGEGVTGTVRQALVLLATAEAQRRVGALRGKVKFSIDLDTMRRDRT